MPKETRIWKVRNGRLDEIERQKLDVEKRIEKWVVKDISVLSDDLMVIGNQVETSFGGEIDLLCLDSNGDTVVVELKRDRTPRQVVAQALDYASWVKDLSHNQITALAEEHFEDDERLDQEFLTAFDQELPEVLGEEHSMLIVGSEIDAHSERIVEYLSESHGVSINAVTFQFFSDDQVGELLARVFLIEPGQVEDRARRKGTSNRSPSLTHQQLSERAEENKVGDWYEKLFKALNLYFYPGTNRSAVAFEGDFREKDFPRKYGVVVSLIPTESGKERGLKFQLYLKRFTVLFGVSEQQVKDLMPEERNDEWVYTGTDWEEWGGSEGYFRSDAEVKHFVDGIQRLMDGKEN